MDGAHEKLATNIKAWLGIDNDINSLKHSTKELQKKKKEITNTLISIMKTNEIDCVDISGGQIVFNQTNSKTPITKPYLTKCFNKYFEDNGTPIPTEDLTDYILNNRSITVKDNIKHKTNKKKLDK